MILIKFTHLAGSDLVKQRNCFVFRGRKQVLNAELIRIIKAVNLVKSPVFEGANHLEGLSTLAQSYPVFRNIPTETQVAEYLVQRFSLR